MRKMDHEGLFLCELQATVFEHSVDRMDSSSEIFIRRFMKSQTAKQFDDCSILASNIQADDILQLIDEEYGISHYGSVKYTHNEMYWIGYICRYFAFTYELSTIQVYKIAKPKELRGMYLAYHTLDPAQAIERMLEEKNLQMDEDAELKRQYEIFRKNRMCADGSCC